MGEPGVVRLVDSVELTLSQKKQASKAVSCELIYTDFLDYFDIEP